MKLDLFSYTLDEMKKWVQSEFHTQAYRGEQIFQFLHQKGISSFSAMTSLPQSLRGKLKEDIPIFTMIIRKIHESSDGTKKYLLKCPHDSRLIESVLLKYKHGYSLCISTQIGCAMHCIMCASGKNGLKRNLTAGEMILQILTIQNLEKIRISNIVLMGAGEPLDNYHEVVKFLKIVHNPKGLNIGYRHITLSTCGITPKIYPLADLKLPITLAISLHAPNDKLRNQIVPINRKYPISEILDACHYYFSKTHRRITFEYAMILGLNDKLDFAKELGCLLSNLTCHVNLIPVNSNNKLFLAPKNPQIYKFQEYLEKHGIPCTIRREMGTDIEAACGQLRNYVISESKESNR